MIEYLIANIWLLILPLEIILLFIFYKFYFAEYNAQRWLHKAESEGFMEGLLRPIIDILVDESTDSITSRLKMEMLSAQGVMSKQVLGNIDPENAEEQLLKVSQTLLESIGYKHPNPMIVMKLAQGIGTMAGKYMGENGSANTANPESIQVGAELFNQ